MALLVADREAEGGPGGLEADGERELSGFGVLLPLREGGFGDFEEEDELSF